MGSGPVTRAVILATALTASAGCNSGAGAGGLRSVGAGAACCFRQPLHRRAPASPRAPRKSPGVSFLAQDALEIAALAIGPTLPRQQWHDRRGARTPPGRDPDDGRRRPLPRASRAAARHPPGGPGDPQFPGSGGRQSTHCRDGAGRLSPGRSVDCADRELATDRASRSDRFDLGVGRRFKPSLPYNMPAADEVCRVENRPCRHVDAAEIQPIGRSAVPSAQ